MSDEDEIASFHKAAAARDKKILMVGAAIALAAGIVALILGFMIESEPGVARYNAKVIILGAVLIVVGIGGIGKALLGHRD